jgi:hypothetical protein
MSKRIRCQTCRSNASEKAMIVSEQMKASMRESGMSIYLILLGIVQIPGATNCFSGMNRTAKLCRYRLSYL